MTRAKIKNAGSNIFAQDIARADVPVIFAEEAFVRWASDDEFIAIILMGEGYIAVHRGGYEGSLTSGPPGSAL